MTIYEILILILITVLHAFLSLQAKEHFLVIGRYMLSCHVRGKIDYHLFLNSFLLVHYVPR